MLIPFLSTTTSKGSGVSVRDTEKVIKAVSYSLETALEKMGLNLSDPNLKDTPTRMAKMYVTEFFKNVGKEFDDFKEFPNDHNYNEIIISGGIDFVSMCSHHFLPFSGKAFIAYLPDKTLIGLSKMARLLDHYAARPQLQENLCKQVLERFVEVIHPKAAMVIVYASHSCMACRGAKKEGSIMITSAMDCPESEKLSFKSEVLNLIQITGNLS